MTGEIDSIGEAVTAALVGTVAEPDRGGHPAHGQGRCLNCGTALAGSHCHRCGQKAHVHRSFGAIGHDLLHAVLHFDGKFWNTLPLLIWRPGELTRRYIHGERASFISPLALFLFAVFLTYAALASIGGGAAEEFGEGLKAGFQDADKGGKPAPTAQDGVKAVRSKAARTLAALDAEIAEAKAAGTDVRVLQERRAALVRGAGLVDLVEQEIVPKRGGPIEYTDSKGASIDTGIPFIDNGIKKAKANPGLLLYKLQANAYKFAWALIPLSMPFLWLLFPFSRRFHMFDHFVFVTYSISFMLLWFVMLRLAGFLPNIVGGPIYAVGVPFVGFHMYRQLRGAYRLSRLGAAVRTLLLLLFCIVTVTLFLLLLLAMGIMG